VQALLVERLERHGTGDDRAGRLQRAHVQRVADLPQQPGGQAGAEDHEDRDPVGRGAQQRGAQQREHDDRRDAEPEPEGRDDDRAGREVAGDPRQQHGDEEHGDHVGDAHRDRGQQPAHQQRRAPHRSDDQRLQQPAIGVAAHRAEREEDRQDDAEEQRDEHGQADERAAGQRALVQRDEPAAVGLQAVERLEGGQCEQAQEAEREEADDEQHAAADGLAQRVTGDDERVAHPSRPTTAAR